ncbi:MAPEG family protein [Aliiglaciecola sp. LCG003]|uniref:MAPEG family protein n=1 Tax=Aliiglaciecola sp. LCG003 TaxID=3053655 RepID=UPI0025742F2C|nr:MAPEG family protein [Aliiglaciecola sp. LCG003]WJG08004.1 MAPEG family protein [Aliiglaciecola sp. LCG003]
MSTPITAFYAGLMGITFLYLSILVIKQRRGLKVSLGDGGDSHFQGVIRAHGNFAEYVPLILILLLIAEQNSVNYILLHAVGTALLIGRIIHAYGLRHHVGVSWQRMWGTVLTFAALLTAAVLNILVVY